MKKIVQCAFLMVLTSSSFFTYCDYIKKEIYASWGGILFDDKQLE